MFLGRYHHSLDAKGRLTIPARFREARGEGAYVVQGFDGNLMVLPPAVFRVLYQRVNRLSITDPKARLLRRLILSAAAEVELDRSGRILLPPYLREAAELDGEVVLVGVGDYFEIWSAEAWERQLDLLEDPEANAGRFAALNLSPAADESAEM